MKICLPTKIEFESVYELHTIDYVADYFSVSTPTIKKWRNYFGLPLKKAKYKNLPQDFTSKQMQIIVGSLLGDGCLSKVSGKQNSKFVENHSIKQKSYISWRHSILLPFSNVLKESQRPGRTKLSNGNIVSDDSKICHMIALKTVVHPFFTLLEKKWYSRDFCENYLLKDGHKVKVLPSDLKLTPLSLSVWYGDDGSNVVRDRNVSLCVYCFTKKECEFLVEQINILGFNTFFVKSNGKYGKIYIKASSYFDFLDMVSDNIPAGLLDYKMIRGKYAAL